MSAVLPLSVTPSTFSHKDPVFNHLYLQAMDALPTRTRQAVSASPSFRNILRYLFLLPDLRLQGGVADDAIQTFDRISRQAFEALSFLADETFLFAKKPRLSYNPEKRIVIVELPCVTREVSVTDIREAFIPVLNLPRAIDKKLLRITLESNFPLGLSKTGLSATPDLCLVVMPLQMVPGLQKFHILAVVECAFSQGRATLEQKIKMELLAHPEIIAVIMICVTETQAYRSPKEGSEAWDLFSKEEDSREASSFLSLGQHSQDDSEDTEFSLEPVVIAGHTWCSINKVEYFVWIKDEVDKPIDIDTVEATRGVLFPQISMNDVELKLAQGLMKMKDSTITLTKDLQVRSNTNTLALEEAHISLSMDWNTIQLGLMPAARFTAHARYEDWYNLAFRGTKCA